MNHVNQTKNFYLRMEYYYTTKIKNKIIKLLLLFFLNIFKDESNSFLLYCWYNTIIRQLDKQQTAYTQSCTTRVRLYVGIDYNYWFALPDPTFIRCNFLNRFFNLYHGHGKCSLVSVHFKMFLNI